MRTETIEIMFKDMTKEQCNKQVDALFEQIEQKGGQVVAAEPIEKIQVTIMGRRFIVEYSN